MKPFTKTQLKTIEKVKQHAIYGGGIYRMNCEGADIYSFSFIHRGHNFEGGWDWSGMSDKNYKGEYFYPFCIILATGEVKINK